MNRLIKTITTLLFLNSSLGGLCAGNKITKPFDDVTQLYNLRLDYALQEALIVAQDYIHENSSYLEFETHPNPDDSTSVVSVNITIGHLFSKKQKHLLIRRAVLWCEYLDLFLVNDTILTQEISHEQEGLSYLNDTIWDVNGDGFKDYLVHWYPFRGCCLRDVYTVYLNHSGDGTFAGGYQFINPTFFPKEKIIRGVEYGYPGRAGLYKFKWDGLQIDTVEYIYPDVNMSGQFIKTRESIYRQSEMKVEKLNEVPYEYLHINGYDWFTDY
jgi:hypothetical protein